MTLLILDMPDDPQQLIEWLEQQLVGLELLQLVDQLTVVHGEPADSVTLEETCSENLAQVLSEGLQPLEPEQIRSLLTHPRLLLELQDQITHKGGEYWDKVPLSTEHQQSVDRGWEQLQRSIAGDDATAADADDKPLTSQSDEKDNLDAWGNPVRRNTRSTLRRYMTACAMALVAGVGIYLLQPPQSTGWSSPAALVQQDSPAATFAALATASGDYLKASRSTPAELQSEIERFIRDCEKVQQLNLPELAAIAHPDANLPDSKTTTYDEWLKVKCAAWAGKAETALTAMQDGTTDFEQASSTYTEILTKLQSALQKQATALS